MEQIEYEIINVVAGCLIKKDGKYLLVQEKASKVYGLWNLPAGHVDKGETIEVAAVREAKEETGYNVELIKEIALYHEETTRPVIHVFSANIAAGELTVNKDELLDVKWLTFDEIKTLQDDDKIRRPWIWDVIQKDQLETI